MTTEAFDGGDTIVTDRPPEVVTGVEGSEGTPAEAGDGQADPVAEVPDQESFTMPEGFDPGDYAERFTEVASELRLSGEAAGKLLAFWAEVARDMEAGRADSWSDARKEWARETMRDREIGGQNLDRSVGLAAKAVNSFGTEGLKEVFRVTGLGNHPEVVRFMARVGRALAEDSFHAGAHHGDSSKRSPAELIYGKH